MAVPARRDPVVRIQPNGDSITVRLCGDEWKHWTSTEDGYRVAENKRGYLCYIQQACGGKEKLSCRIAKDANKRSRCEQVWLKRKGIK